MEKSQHCRQLRSSIKRLMDAYDTDFIGGHGIVLICSYLRVRDRSSVRLLRRLDCNCYAFSSDICSVRGFKFLIALVNAKKQVYEKREWESRWE